MLTESTILSRLFSCILITRSGGRLSFQANIRTTIGGYKMENNRVASSKILPKTPSRASNIELLRIITILGVIILHYNNESIGGGYKYVLPDSLNYYVLDFLESVFICAVDLFILISGYFMINTQKRSIIKPLKLIIQVVVFKLAFFILLLILGKSDFSIKRLVGNILPDNYFVILYCVVFFVSPYINLVMKSLDKKQLKRMTLTIFLIFSVYAIVVDVLSDFRGDNLNGLSSVGLYGSQSGYTIVNFIMMYIIGAYIRLNDEKMSNYKNRKLIPIFFALVIVDMIWFNALKLLNIKSQTAHSYLNPIVVMMAVVAFLIFKNIDIGSKSVINNLAKGSFTVFLAHSYMITSIKIESFVNENILILLAHIVISVVGIYLICWVLFFVYEKVTMPIYTLIEKKIGKTEYTVE